MRATPIGLESSRAIHRHLTAEGYLDPVGRPTDKFDPKYPHFKLDVPAEFADLRPQITDVVRQHTIGSRVANARERRAVAVDKQVLLDPGFAALWGDISRQTRYRVDFDTEALIKAAVTEIQVQNPVRPIQINVEKAEVTPGLAGVGVRETASRYAEVERAYTLPDILGYLQNETRLTRKTLAAIIERSGRAEHLKVNPQAFVTQVATALNKVLNRLVVDGISYEPVDAAWDMRRLEDDAEGGALTAYLDRLYAVQSAGKTPYDHIQYDSTVEHEFARACDQDERVRFYVKLPSWFRVQTPVGEYNPDWALRLAEPDRLVLVRETKDTLDAYERRNTENAKIACAKRHFAALGVNYAVATDLRSALATP